MADAARTVARRPAARLLVESVTGRPQGSPLGATHEDLQLAARAADNHRVLPALCRRLADDPATPDRWRPALRTARHEQAVRHLGTVAEALRLGSLLDDAGVPWMVAKGPVAAAHLWPEADLRQYYDLDLYVSRHDFASAVAALEEAGCRGADRNWPLMLAEMRAEYALRAPRGTHVDLHWDYAVLPALRSRFNTDLDGMIARRQAVDVGGGRRLFSPDHADTVLLLAFHAAQAGANRLVWLADVRFALLAARERAGALEQVVVRARDSRTERPVAMVIARAARVLGLPDDVLGQLVPLLRAAGPLGAAARLQDRRIPFPGLPGDRHQGGALYGAARPGLMTCAGALVTDLVRRRAIERRVRRFPEAAGKALRRDVPDLAAKREYLLRSTTA